MRAGCRGRVTVVVVMVNDSFWREEVLLLAGVVVRGITSATHAQVRRSAHEQFLDSVPARVLMTCISPCAMPIEVSGRFVVVASVSVSSLVTKILISSSVPVLHKPFTALLNSSTTHEVQVEDFTIQMNVSFRSGKGCFRARAEMSRRRGRLKVMPVEPAMSMTESKAAKSR